MLQDPDLLQSARERLMQEKVNAEYIWQQLIEETAVRYRSLEDEYQRARANDVVDAGRWRSLAVYYLAFGVTPFVYGFGT